MAPYSRQVITAILGLRRQVCTGSEPCSAASPEMPSKCHADTQWRKQELRENYYICPVSEQQHLEAFLQTEAFSNEKQPQINDSGRALLLPKRCFRVVAGICKKAKSSCSASRLKDLTASDHPQVSSGWLTWGSI